MKAALLRALYPAVGGFATVYAETDDSAEATRKRWQATRGELAAAGCREPTLDAIELVLTDPDLPPPGHAIFARDGAVVGTIALLSAPPMPVAHVGPLPQLRHALTNAPLLDSPAEFRQLAIIAGVEAPARSVALTAVTGARALTLAAEALTLAADELAKRLAELRELDQAAREVAQGIVRGVVQGVVPTMAALRDGRVAAVFLGSDPALAEPAWVGPGGTELAATRTDLAEAGLLAPLCDRTDEAIIRAAASNNADLFILGKRATHTPDLPDLPELVEGVAATLRYPRPMS